MLEYIRHLEELQILSMIRENSGLYSFDSEFWRGGIENFKNLKGGIENLPITGRINHAESFHLFDSYIRCVMFYN
jgi:hypothetical protein